MREIVILFGVLGVLVAYGIVLLRRRVERARDAREKKEAIETSGLVVRLKSAAALGDTEETTRVSGPITTSKFALPMLDYMWESAGNELHPPHAERVRDAAAELIGCIARNKRGQIPDAIPHLRRILTERKDARDMLRAIKVIIAMDRRGEEFVPLLRQIAERDAHMTFACPAALAVAVLTKAPNADAARRALEDASTQVTEGSFQ